MNLSNPSKPNNPSKPSSTAAVSPVQLSAPVPVVGLTGGIGSGKTQVSNHLQALGIPVVDTDCIAHELTAAQGAAMPAIAQAFGQAALNADGSLNRAYMRGLVFANSAHKHTLENILHPAIRQEVTTRLAQIATAPYAVVVVPLLFESTQWQNAFWQIVVVDCPPEQQIARVQARNAWPLEQIYAVLAQQVSRETRLGRAQHVVHNHGSLADLHQQVDALHARLLAALRL